MSKSTKVQIKKDAESNPSPNKNNPPIRNNNQKGYGTLEVLISTVKSEKRLKK